MLYTDFEANVCNSIYNVVVQRLFFFSAPVYVYFYLFSAYSNVVLVLQDTACCLLSKVNPSTF